MCFRSHGIGTGDPYMFLFHSSIVGWTVSSVGMDGHRNHSRWHFIRVVTAGYVPRIRVGMHVWASERTAGSLNLLYCGMARHKVSGSAEMRVERRRVKQRHHFSLSSRCAGKY